MGENADGSGPGENPESPDSPDDDQGSDLEYGFDVDTEIDYEDAMGSEFAGESAEAGAAETGTADAETADAESGSQVGAYESPDVSLDPDDLDPDEDDEVFDAIQDQEMPLADHIEEMIKRLGIVLVIAGVVSLAFFFAPTGNGTLAERSINFLWNSILPEQKTTRPVVYGPLALIVTEFKVASLAGVIVAIPVLIYESYQFMKPGLYPHERRYYLASVPTSLVLALVGVAFAYRPILPIIFGYFYSYTKNVSDPAFGLTKTFDLILAMMGYFAVIFQIPLFIMLAIMMGVTTRDWLADRRLYFWGGFLGISFFFVVADPTGVAPIIIAATMIVLFEGTLFLLKWTGR